MTRELAVLTVIGLSLLDMAKGNAPSFESVARAGAFATVLPAGSPPIVPPQQSAAPPAPSPSCAALPVELCPMQAWMKANASAPLAAHDFEALVASFGRLAVAAPPGFVNWASIARDGADAARVEDVEAVEAACRGCHAQYAVRYHASGDRPR